MSRDCNSVTSGCTGTVGPDYSSGQSDSQCQQQPNGNYCPSPGTQKRCSSFDLSKSRDSCYIDSLSNEIVEIAGAEFNVYKLLGVHEQGQLVDVTGHGLPISNGDWPNFPASNAYDIYISEWRSIQCGSAVLASAYLGYDFGEIKTNDGSRRAYGVDTSIYKHITSIAIKQSSNPLRRATKIRIERSEDGSRWLGVAVIDLPDDDCLTTAFFKSSVPSRYWRLRPLEFNGTTADENWGVQALQLFHDYQATDIHNIQDKVLLENKDRDYNTDPIMIKGSYDLVDVPMELTQFGGEFPAQTIYAQIGFSSCVAALGRPVIIGDIVELPSETQYTPNMVPVKKWMEVTDVAWSTEGYTPGWQPTLMRVILQPAYFTQETQDVFGDLASTEVEGGIGLVDGEDGNSSIFQDYFDSSQTVKAEAKDAVPERGAAGSNTIREFEETEIQQAAAAGVPNIDKLGLNPTGLYVEDAMPPNNAPYTEGSEFPPSPSHGDYHRMTYEGLSEDVPARLYRYSSSKGRWIFLEKDKRAEMNHNKPVLQEFTTSAYAVDENQITSAYRDRLDD